MIVVPQLGNCIVTRGYGCRRRPPKPQGICLPSNVCSEFLGNSQVLKAIAVLSWLMQHSQLESPMTSCTVLQSLITLQIELSSRVANVGSKEITLESPITLEIILDSPISVDCN